MITLLLPCWNEKSAIPKVIPAAQKTCERFAKEWNINAELLVVDDGSRDGSSDLLNAYDVSVLKNDHNQGYGYSLKRGIQAAKTDWVAIMDLDSTIDPDDFLTLFQSTTNQSMIVGQRIHESTSMPHLRQLGNTLYSGALYCLFHKWVKDPCSGARLIHKKTIEPLLPYLPNDLSFTLALTVLYLSKEKKFEEHPIFYGSRDGLSKLSTIKDGARFLKTIYSYSRLQSVSFG